MFRSKRFDDLATHTPPPYLAGALCCTRLAAPAARPPICDTLFDTFLAPQPLHDTCFATPGSQLAVCFVSFLKDSRRTTSHLRRPPCATPALHHTHLALHPARHYTPRALHPARPYTRAALHTRSPGTLKTYGFEPYCLKFQKIAIAIYGTSASAPSKHSNKSILFSSTLQKAP